MARCKYDRLGLCIFCCTYLVLQERLISTRYSLLFKHVLCLTCVAFPTNFVLPEVPLRVN